jgi:hypothetical protein
MSFMTHLDELLEQTLRPPQGKNRIKPPQKKPGVFYRWASSQVAAYRLGLVLGYVGMVYFGSHAFFAGIVAFTFTTPWAFWTPVWASLVILGGLVAAIGAIRAGTEPITREVRIFNRIELTGSTILFVTLTIYAGVLLTLGYGFGDSGRASVGSGFVALGIQPAVRMVWLIFRPRRATKTKPSTNDEAAL